jgi:hypothetical protein
MSESRVFVPLMVTGLILVIAKRWPQAMWNYVYLNVHQSNVNINYSQGGGQTG